MKHKEPLVDVVVVRCSSCGKKEFLELTDKQYLEDVLEEIGWKNRKCPRCQERR